MFKKIALAFVVAAFAMTSAQAGQVNGTLAISDLGPTSANNADITLATVFSIGDLFASATYTGDFATYPLVGPAARDLGPSTLTLANPAGFSFNNTAFGDFTAASVTLLSSTSGQFAQVSFFLLGTYTPGSVLQANGFNSGPQAASFTVSFTQTGGPNSAVSDSGTLSTPPATFGTPEPATFVALVSGLGVVALARLRRKSA